MRNFCSPADKKKKRLKKYNTDLYRGQHAHVLTKNSGSKAVTGSRYHYYLVLTFDFKTSRTFRFYRISCFFRSKRHQGWCVQLSPGAHVSAAAWPEAGNGCHRAKLRQKNGGPQENLSWVFALSCQLFAKTVISGEAFHPSLHTYSGLRRSYDPLGCHGGWENPTTGMTVNVSSLTC